MIAVFDTHPVQYRAPLYRELARLLPGQFKVVYASDFSVKGYRDLEFGHRFAWDVPLLEGYESVVLSSGSARNWKVCGALIAWLWKAKPGIVLLPDPHGRFFWTIYAMSLLCGSKLCLRAETQDEAFSRSRAKGLVRSLYYRLAYVLLWRIFYIGRLNRDHYLAHGVPPRKLVRSPYATVDRVKYFTPEQKQRERDDLRQRLGIGGGDFVVAFFGKLISKKNPDLLIEAATRLEPEMRKRIVILYVGSGELEARLRELASTSDLRVVFAGFVNQMGLPAYYLAADAMVLPSRQAGETWGLVVNEALQAGCAVVLSRGVGCAVEFGELPRVDVIEIGDASALAVAIVRSMGRERDFAWALPALQDYSMEVAAENIAAELTKAR